MLAQKAIRIMKLLQYKLDYGHKSQGTCVVMYPVTINTFYTLLSGDINLILPRLFTY